MSSLNLISLATIKSQLGLSVTTYDTALTALIPIISADVRRILNNNFDEYYGAIYSAGSANIQISGQPGEYQLLMYKELQALPLGTVITGDGIATDTYLTAYNLVTGIYTMSANATSSAAYVYPTISIAQWPTIAKMVWYKYSKQNITSADVRGVASESYGPVSISYSDSEINKQYDYPSQLIADLGTAYARVG